MNHHLTNRALEVLNNKRFSTRNITIFLLSLYCGIQRSEIIKLKWSDIIDGNIIINSRKLKLPNAVSKHIEILKDFKVENKIKIDNVFVTKYRSQYLPASEVTIYDDLKISIGWKNCCPEKIATSLIPMLYKNGYSIEEIAYITGKNLANLEKIISYKDMIKNIEIEKKRRSKKHPFADILGMV